MMRLVILIVLVFAVLEIAEAQENKYCEFMDFAMFSHHWDRDRGYNETNNVLGCTNMVGRVDVMLFKNSNYDWALFLSDYKEFKNFHGLSLGFDYGVVFGYDPSPAPVILPKAEYEAFGFKFTGYLLFAEGVAIKFSKRIW